MRRTAAVGQAGSSSSSRSRTLEVIAEPDAEVVRTLPKEKRRRNAGGKACELCKRRRTKCIFDDSSSQSCRYCRANKLECIITGIDRRKDSVRAIRARLNYLEDLTLRIKTCQDHELMKVIEEIRRPGGEDGLTSGLATCSPLLLEQHYSSSGNTAPLPSDTALFDGLWAPTSASLRTVLDLSGNAQWEANVYGSSPHSQSGALAQSIGFNDEPLSTATIPSPKTGEAMLELAAMVDNLTFDQEGQIRAISALLTSDSPGGRTKDVLSIHDIKQAAGTKRTPPPARPVDMYQNLPILTGSAANVSALPLGTDIRTVEHLLHLFFLWHHSMWPIMSQALFLESFCSGGKYYTPLLLNVMLAVASHFSDWTIVRSNSQDPHTAGDSFFATAKALLDAELQRPSISTIQALALMAEREAFMGRGVMGGLYFVMCGRLVLDLGLHLNAKALEEGGKLDEADMYVRSKTFWGIYSLDKGYSACVARPSCLRDTIITCPRPGYWQLDDIDWWRTCQASRILPMNNGSGSPQGTTYIFDRALELAAIYSDAMERVYWTEESVPVQHRLKMLKVSMDIIRKSYSQLPSLSWLSDQAGTLNSSPILLYIHLAHHGQTIILNRPFLTLSDAYNASICGQHGNSMNGLDTPVDRCFDSARAVVSIVKMISMSTRYSLRISLNLHQCALVMALVVLLFEAYPTPAGSAKVDAGALLSRQQFARDALDEGLVYLTEMAGYRLAAADALTSVTQMINVRKTQVDQARLMAAGISATTNLQGSGAVGDHAARSGDGIAQTELPQAQNGVAAVPAASFEHLTAPWDYKLSMTPWRHFFETNDVAGASNSDFKTQPPSTWPPDTMIAGTAVPSNFFAATEQSSGYGFLSNYFRTEEQLESFFSNDLLEYMST